MHTIPPLTAQLPAYPIGTPPAYPPYAYGSQPAPLPMQSPPPGVQYPAGYTPPPPSQSRRSWWWQMLGFVLGTGGALFAGYLPFALALWVAVGDSPTPPAGSAEAQNWVIATYLLGSMAVGALVVSIMSKRPWIALTAAALTLASFAGMVVMFARMWQT